MYSIFLNKNNALCFHQTVIIVKPDKIPSKSNDDNQSTTFPESKYLILKGSYFVPLICFSYKINPIHLIQMNAVLNVSIKNLTSLLS